MRILPGIVLFVFAVFSWNCSNACASQKEKEIKDLLDSPSVVDKFKKTKGKRTSKTKDKESPLVKEAKSFSLYLNPPKKVEKRPTKINKKTKSIVKKPTNVSAKFKVAGTSFSQSDPSKSLALLDIAGKGLRWIRQGDKVGHVVIEEVKPGGTIVIRDGKSTSEMTVEKRAEVNLLKGNQPDMKELAGQIESMFSSSSDSKSETSSRIKRPAPNKSKAPREFSEEEIKQQEQMMQELMAQVGEMFKAAGQDVNSFDSANTPEPHSLEKAQKKPEVENPVDDNTGVYTVEQASELIEDLSERFDQLQSNSNGTDVKTTEKSIQSDAEDLRKAVSNLKRSELSPEDKGKLTVLDRKLAKIQQEIRRAQSRNRIENARRKSRR